MAMKFTHGTIYSYKHGRCRCVDCRQANTDYSRRCARAKRLGLNLSMRVATTDLLMVLDRAERFPSFFDEEVDACQRIRSLLV